MKAFIPLFFCVMSIVASAQWVPSSTTIRTPYGNTTVTSYQHMPQMWMPPGSSGKTLASMIYYELSISLKNDSTFNAGIWLLYRDSVQKIRIAGNQRKGTEDTYYKPSDTKQVSRLDPKGKLLIGVPVDTCWLFHVIKGKINAHAPIPAESYDYITAIQKGNDGPILPLTKQNLAAMIEEDPKLMKLIEKEKFKQVIWKYNSR